MRKPEFPFAAVAALAVMISNVASLISAVAPRWSSDLEHTTFIVTLPASLLAVLLRSRDEDSIILWSIGALVWIAAAFAQFWILAALPRYMCRRRSQRQFVLTVVLIVVGMSLLWLASKWPSQPQEEPVLFFVRVPLWFLTAGAIIFILVWAPWQNRGVDEKATER